MLNKQKLEQALIDTLADAKLSSSEKYALRDIFSDFETDAETLNYIRNRAFDLAKDQMREGEATPLSLLKWLEQVVKTIDTVRHAHPILPSSVHFSPGNECADRIIGLLRNAQENVDVCVFTISDDRISRELAAAHRRGVTVRIITDNDKSSDRGSDIEYLAGQGVAVRMDTSPSHMHHKFALFDQRQLVNGSFNWTRSASKYNQENIVVSSDADVIDEFVRTYQRLWMECKPFS